MKKNFWNIIVSIGAVLLAAVMIIVYYAFIVPKGNYGEKNVTLQIEYAENSYNYQIRTNKTTVYELLEEMNEDYFLELEAEDELYGKYIVSMKGVQSQDNKYYIYTINNDYALSVSEQTIKDGDIIKFQFVSQEYDENWNLISSTLQGKGTNAIFEKIKLPLICICVMLILISITYLILGILKKKND